MDDIELLSRMRADVPEVDPLALRRARRRLLARAVGPRLSEVRSRRRRTAVRFAVAAGLAAVLAGGLVATDSLTNSGRPVTGASADAAELLNLAADRTQATPDPVVRPGQYRYVVTHAWYGNAIVGFPEDRDRTMFYLTEQRYEVWIPFNESGIWYRRYTRPLSAKFFSAADERFIRLHHPDWLRPQVELYTGANGGMAPNQAAPQADWGVPTSAWLATLPRDPVALLARIYQDTAGAGPDRDTEAFVAIGDVLRTGLVPSDLRAALYRAAARIPGVRLIDNAANLDGKRGVAVGRDNPWGARDEIIFDSEAGQFIGERSVSIDPRIAQAPAGSVVGSTAVTVSIAARPGFH